MLQFGLTQSYTYFLILKTQIDDVQMFQAQHSASVAVWDTAQAMTNKGHRSTACAEGSMARKRMASETAVRVLCGGKVEMVVRMTRKGLVMMIYKYI